MYAFGRVSNITSIPSFISVGALAENLKEYKNATKQNWAIRGLETDKKTKRRLMRLTANTDQHDRLRHVRFDHFEGQV